MNKVYIVLLCLWNLFFYKNIVNSHVETESMPQVELINSPDLDPVQICQDLIQRPVEIGINVHSLAGSTNYSGESTPFGRKELLGSLECSGRDTPYYSQGSLTSELQTPRGRKKILTEEMLNELTILNPENPDVLYSSDIARQKMTHRKGESSLNSFERQAIKQQLITTNPLHEPHPKILQKKFLEVHPHALTSPKKTRKRKDSPFKEGGLRGRARSPRCVHIEADFIDHSQRSDGLYLNEGNLKKHQHSSSVEVQVIDGCNYMENACCQPKSFLAACCIPFKKKWNKQMFSLRECLLGCLCFVPEQESL